MNETERDSKKKTVNEITNVRNSTKKRGIRIILSCFFLPSFTFVESVRMKVKIKKGIVPGKI